MSNSTHLRLAALALLQAASRIQRKTSHPYSVVHRHEYGESHYIIWSKHEPSQADAADRLLVLPFHPETGESISIRRMGLHQLCGLDEADTISLPEPKNLVTKHPMATIVRIAEAPNGQDDLVVCAINSTGLDPVSYTALQAAALCLANKDTRYACACPRQDIPEVVAISDEECEACGPLTF